MEKTKSGGKIWKRSFRLGRLEQVHLVLEILTTNKRTEFLAKEYGVAPATVSYYRQRLRNPRGEPAQKFVRKMAKKFEKGFQRFDGSTFLFYRRNGSLLY